MEIQHELRDVDVSGAARGVWLVKVRLPWRSCLYIHRCPAAFGSGTIPNIFLNTD